MNEKISSVSYIFLHFYRQPRSNRWCNKNSRCLETKLPRFSTFRFVTLRDWWWYVHTVVSRLIKRLSHSVQTRRAVAQFQLRTKANKSYVFVTRTFLPVPTYALLNQPRSSDSFLPSLSSSFFLSFFLLRVFRLFSTRHGRFRTRPLSLFLPLFFPLSLRGF